MQENAAIQNARLFVSKGFPGRHNDNNAVVQWFVSRLAEINNAFGRGENKMQYFVNQGYWEPTNAYSTGSNIRINPDYSVSFHNSLMAPGKTIMS